MKSIIFIAIYAITNIFQLDKLYIWSYFINYESAVLIIQIKCFLSTALLKNNLKDSIHFNRTYIYPLIASNMDSLLSVTKTLNPSSSILNILCKKYLQCYSGYLLSWAYIWYQRHSSSRSYPGCQIKSKLLRSWSSATGSQVDQT